MNRNNILLTIGGVGFMVSGIIAGISAIKNYKKYCDETDVIIKETHERTMEAIKEAEETLKMIDEIQKDTDEMLKEAKERQKELKKLDKKTDEQLESLLDDI